MGDDENVLENLHAEIEQEHKEHPMLEIEESDSEARKVVKRLLNWYWGYDEAEGSQEITDLLYEFDLAIEPAGENRKRVDEMNAILKDKDSTIKFYKEKAEERLERVEGLMHEIFRLDPNHKNCTIFECSSLANNFPYADEKLRQEVLRANRRENMLLNEMCEQKERYGDLLKKYWNLKQKYEPEPASGDTVTENGSHSNSNDVNHKEPV